MANHVIDKDVCISCGVCAPECPVEAIKEEGGTYVIDANCIDCGVCVGVCPVTAISAK